MGEFQSGQRCDVKSGPNPVITTVSIPMTDDMRIRESTGKSNFLECVGVTVAIVHLGMVAVSSQDSCDWTIEALYWLAKRSLCEE